MAIYRYAWTGVCGDAVLSQLQQGLNVTINPPSVVPTIDIEIVGGNVGDKMDLDSAMESSGWEYQMTL
jgi:hypothetical protein